MKTGGDPRLHLFETVVREQGIDLAGKKDVKVEGITVEKTMLVGTTTLAPSTPPEAAKKPKFTSAPSADL